MQVETYEIESVASGALDLQEEVQQEMKELIESIGLEGQQGLLTGSKDEPGDIIPYTKLDMAATRIWKNFCPQQEQVKKYAGGIMPLRVLQVIAHAEKMGWFKTMYVWSENEYRIDPVLIGVEEGGDHYLLARWGDALESYEEIVQKAKKKWLEKATVELQKVRDESEMALKNLEGLWAKVLRESWVREAGVTLSSI